MSKGLEALQRIKNRLYPLEIEETKIIEKELQALEIIKSHGEFGKKIPLPNMKTNYDLLISELTQEEYDLLKEIICHDKD